MSCCGQHKRRDAPRVPDMDAPGMRKPSEPCVYCAYKHFHTARRLAQEPFYTAVNRGDIEGELVLAQWHLWKLGKIDLCRSLRDVRHLVERFRENEIGWMPMVDAFDALLKSENEKGNQE